VTSGTFDNTLSLTDPSSINPAFVTLIGGTLADAVAALVTGINTERHISTSTPLRFGGDPRLPHPGGGRHSGARNVPASAGGSRLDRRCREAAPPALLTACVRRSGRARQRRARVALR
jgi:hypothetical protein